MERIYIETTIPSFYFEKRTEPEMVSRMHWTRKWWQEYKDDYELVTSEAVLDEIRKGDFDAKNDILDLLAELPILLIQDSIIEITKTYILQKLMPRDPAGDALHLAVASYYNCNYLLTWNCKHLANANKFNHITKINSELKLQSPLIVTPLELLNEDY